MGSDHSASCSAASRSYTFGCAANASAFPNPDGAMRLMPSVFPVSEISFHAAGTSTIVGLGRWKESASSHAMTCLSVARVV